MGVTLLASGVAETAARLAFDVGVPLIGLICLVIGLWERSRNRRRSRPGPPFPAPTGYPGPYMGYPGSHTGYPHPYPGPPHLGYPTPAPPPRRASKSSTALITIGAVVLAFGIFGNLAVGLSRFAKHQAHTSMRVGECITQMAYRSESFTSSPGNDCANPANTYVLAARGGSAATCPDGKREGSVYDRYTDGSTILCFALNLKQGQCYLVSGDRDSPKLSLGDCNDTQSGVMKVAQRIDASTDTSGCPAGTKPVSYPTPPIVYCLERAAPS